MDSFIEIPREKWPEVRDSFKQYWPQGLRGYYGLDNQIRLPELGAACGFRVYCPYGDFRNGIIATNVKGVMSEIIIYLNSRNTEKIEEALVTTKLIQWDGVIVLPHCGNEEMKLVRRVAKRLGLVKLIEAATVQHILTKDTKPYDLVPPPNTYMGPIRLEDIPQVDKVWPHRYATSPQFFELLIKNGLSYGLYSSEDHSLLAWMLINEVGFLTHLYVDEKHRGKGYADYIVKYVSNDQLKLGKDIFGFVVEDNVPSLRLFRKVEYDVTGRGVWMFYSSSVKKIDFTSTHEFE